jgi:hypothetical protein
MPNTYTLISSTTVGAGSAANITFSSIPNTYTDLSILISGRGASNGGGTNQAWDNFTVKFNGSSSNYSGRWLNNTDNSSNSGSSTSLIYSFSDYAGATANTFANVGLYIPNYASSNFKSVSLDNAPENNSTANVIGLTAGLWSDTAAITSVTFTLAIGNWAQYSSAYLYGIKKD